MCHLLYYIGSFFFKIFRQPIFKQLFQFIVCPFPCSTDTDLGSFAFVSDLFNKLCLLSSVRGGIFIRITSPLLTGVSPMFAAIIAFSIVPSIFFSHGCIRIVLGSGVLILETWVKGELTP